MEGIPFVWYFFPEFDESSGRLIIHVNHAYTDAAGMFPILTAFTEDQDFKGLAKVGAPTFWQKFVLSLIFPISILELGYDVLSLPI